MRRKVERHDGQVDDAEVVRAVHLQVRVDDTVLLAREHRAGAGSVYGQRISRGAES